eukprot:gene11407-12436_t
MFIIIAGLIHFVVNVVLIFFLFIIGIWIYQFFNFRSKEIQHSLVKTAKGYPIIGNLLDFQRNIVYETLLNYPKVYGPFVQCSIVNVHGLLVTDLSVAKELLTKRPKKFSRPSALDYANELLGLDVALFNANGSLWGRTRKATAPSFSLLNITSKFQKINEEMLSWIERLQMQIQPQKKKGISVDMRYEAFTLTIRTLTAVAFGLDTDSGNDTSSSSLSSCNKNTTNSHLSDYFFSITFKEDVEKIFGLQRESALFGLPRFLWKYSRYYKYEVAAREANQRFTDACTRVIEHKRQFWRDQGGLTPLSEGRERNRPTSMLDSLLAQEVANSDSGGMTASSKLMNDDELISNVKIVYIAGTDTTAVTITWLVYYSALYPEYLQRIRDETKRVLFSSVSDDSNQTFQEVLSNMKQVLSDLSHTSLKELPYTTAMIKESLRLGAPVPTIALEVAAPEDPNETTAPVTLSNGITVSPGVTLLVNVDGLHRIEEVFEDPLTFQPSRWLKKETELDGDYLQRLEKMESHLMPFGSGPRICPGMNLANFEAILAIAYLSYFYDMNIDCPVQEILRVPNFVATANKMPIYLTPRFPL